MNCLECGHQIDTNTFGKATCPECLTVNIHTLTSATTPTIERSYFPSPNNRNREPKIKGFILPHTSCPVPQVPITNNNHSYNGCIMCHGTLEITASYPAKVKTGQIRKFIPLKINGRTVLDPLGNVATTEIIIPKYETGRVCETCLTGKDLGPFYTSDGRPSLDPLKIGEQVRLLCEKPNTTRITTKSGSKRDIVEHPTPDDNPVKLGFEEIPHVILGYNALGKPITAKAPAKNAIEYRERIAREVETKEAKVDVSAYRALFGLNRRGKR